MSAEEPRRPNPEELMERYGLSKPKPQRVEGKLRIFLGAAPGVGKTFAMLNEGLRLRSQGKDVVIGLVETHGRAETIERIGDLEVVPRRDVIYQSVAIKELDVAAVLRRGPDIVLIDELAHTNAPGSPRPKRVDDVEALLSAGIDVITTLNVQHIETMNDVVESITGIHVKETVPDRILEHADIQLVDLPVESLIERLQQGKIYPAPTAKRALEGFFRAGNLTALRELALRRTAAGVDDHLDRYMRDHKIENVWPAAERVLVLLESGAEVPRVLRRAWRVASSMHAELVAVIAASEKAERQRSVQLAEDLGAAVRIVEGGDLAAALAETAKTENASMIVIGYAPRDGWRGRMSESLVDRLLKVTQNVDLLIIEPRSAGSTGG